MLSSLQREVVPAKSDQKKALQAALDRAIPAGMRRIADALHDLRERREGIAAKMRVAQETKAAASQDISTRAHDDQIAAINRELKMVDAQIGEQIKRLTDARDAVAADYFLSLAHELNVAAPDLAESVARAVATVEQCEPLYVAAVRHAQRHGFQLPRFLGDFQATLPAIRTLKNFAARLKG